MVVLVDYSGCIIYFTWITAYVSATVNLIYVCIFREVNKEALKKEMALMCGYNRKGFFQKCGHHTRLRVGGHERIEEWFTTFY